MATDLGKVGLVMKGTYNSANTYELLDAVTYNGGTYIAKQNVPANTAPTNTTYWQEAVSPSLLSGKFAEPVSYSLSDTTTMYTFDSDGYLLVSGTAGDAYIFGSSSGYNTYFVVTAGTRIYVKKNMRTRLRTEGLTEYKFIPCTY